MLPARFAPILFGLILSGIMSCIVTGVATLKAVGFSAEAPGLWMGAWSFGWPVAFAVVLVVAPGVRRLVAILVKSPPAPNR
ncbi:DUF2798 domain-containing protein [Phaeobacter porticola]|uniref:DUF2798 domain-containing protein n=1 Tax=Phaeobacter porticola TaxID=1844006 RepID=A0A1L3I0A8_9RHOB|nr:DUF2798 domain-containing protein [Phaeobacter porticola]APG45558.1 hypothetical protein PhaeoP97_00103 [Phaeobacter porticola]